MSAPIRTLARRWHALAEGAVALAAIVAGCTNKNEFVSIDIPRMVPNPATIGQKSVISVVVFNRVGCNLATIKVTYGVAVVSTQAVDIGRSYTDSVTVTGTGPVKAEATCGEAINTQAAILTAN